MSIFETPTQSDPSIAELGEQLDAFVAQIQARLAAISDTETQQPEPPPEVTRSLGNERPLDRLAAIKQRLSERMESYHAN